MKHIISLLLTAIVMSVAMIGSTVFAEEGYTDYTEAASQELLIDADVENTYTVRIPAALHLSQSDTPGVYNGTYTLAAKGFTLTNDTVYIEPEFTTISPTCGENTVNGIIQQNNTEWGKNVISTSDFF